jgi:sigma-B regulation protein RsbU (phosphoserine phosphatase)
VANALLAADPADMMTRLNRALMRRAVEARFATMFYGVLSVDGSVRYANAGQEPPVVVRKNALFDALEEGGPVLGMLSRAVYAFGTASLQPGDIVVLCSDGVTEARNSDSEEFGRERLRATLAGEHGHDPESVLERLLAAIREFSGAEPQADDITLLVLRYKGL